MKALTQCWFTRMHMPEARAHKEDDGSHTSWCRHCERPIVSWDKARWFLADGFNVTHLAETVGGRFLFVLDTLEEAVIARHPVEPGVDEVALEALKAELREKFAIGQPGSTLELHDSGASPAVKRKEAASRARRTLPAPRNSRLSASF